MEHDGGLNISLARTRDQLNDSYSIFSTVFKIEYRNSNEWGLYFHQIRSPYWLKEKETGLVGFSINSAAEIVDRASMNQLPPGRAWWLVIFGMQEVSCLALFCEANSMFHLLHLESF
jgi:hypothetical protein